MADLKTCDSCGGSLTANGQDMFWAVQIQIRKGIAWTMLERDRAERLARQIRIGGDVALATAMADAEPASFPGDKVPSLITHADLRICFTCVLTNGAAVNLIDLIRASERGAGVPSSKTA